MKKKSFTLVEIMIVVAIIAILAAIAVPSLSANRDSAVQRTKDSNVKMVNAAINSYLADNISKNRDDIDDNASYAQIKKYMGPDYATISTLDIAGDSITITASTVKY